jgi:hypothetical protein
MWRHCTGRWFVFRDRPTWFVAMCARSRLFDILHDGASDDSTPDRDIEQFDWAARDEMRLRHRQAHGALMRKARKT